MSIPPRATPALIVFLFVLVVLVALPEGASAEGNCPPGFYPIGGQGVQGCAPIWGSGSNGTVNALKPSTCPQTSALSGEYDKTTVL